MTEYRSLLCPEFPVASRDVGAKLSGLKDPSVDAWMINLYKLKLQLNACKDTTNTTFLPTTNK